MVREERNGKLTFQDNKAMYAVNKSDLFGKFDGIHLRGHLAQEVYTQMMIEALERLNTEEPEVILKYLLNPEGTTSRP